MLSRASGSQSGGSCTLGGGRVDPGMVILEIRGGCRHTRVHVCTCVAYVATHAFSMHKYTQTLFTNTRKELVWVSGLEARSLFMSVPSSPRNSGITCGRRTPSSGSCPRGSVGQIGPCGLLPGSSITANREREEEEGQAEPQATGAEDTSDTTRGTTVKA